VEIGTILALVKIVAEIYQDERGLYLSKERERIEKDYLDEMSKPDDLRSDLTLDRLHFAANALAKRAAEPKR
jgi:hypothetical protein